ncbi:MAG TPA: hypothetical protein DC013_10330 [Ruminococcaceae bacterium]|jgi:hypothetical protein|nr:hypothetical protein [Oscillospiraceae bacterium]
MDVFVEQLVKRKNGASDFLISGGIIVLGVVVAAAGLLIPAIAPFEVILAAGIIYGAYYLISSRNLEYEYSTTNGDFTVDKIINRRRRKRVCQLDLHSVEEMGKYQAEAMKNRPFDRRLNVGADAAGTGAWYMIARIPQLGNTLLILSPNERVLNAVKPFLPRQVSIHAFSRN